MPMPGHSRAAIVIGNGEYAEGKLGNPTRDAVAIDKKLQNLGFETICRTNVDRQGLFDVLSDFRDRFETASIALLFYAGHGIQDVGKNYLLPVETKLRRVMDLSQFGVELKIFIDNLQEVSRTSVLFLDCCRNNPFIEQIAVARGALTRDIRVRPGLTEVKAPVGTFIAFATNPDNVAEDGSGDHSPFTQALLDHIDRPNQSISDMMIGVTNDVLKATNNLQQPWYQQSLLERFVFKAEEASAPAKSRTRAEEEWFAISASNSISVFETFIRAHPRSRFRKYAEAKIADVRASSNAAQTISRLGLPSSTQFGWIPIRHPNAMGLPTPPAQRFGRKKLLGFGNMMDPTTLEGLISISTFSVAKIMLEDGRGIGTGFVVRGKDILDSLGQELFVFTAAHVVGGVRAADFSVPFDRILVSFEGMASRGLAVEPFPVQRIVATAEDSDFTLLGFDGRIDDLARPISLAKSLPEFNPKTPLSRSTRPPVISVSYPYGGGVKFGSIDNYLLDYDRSAITDDNSPSERPVQLHYTAASEPGSSGCPILNEQLEVIALHQGGGDSVLRLNGIEGRYAANFGIWIQSIIVRLAQAGHLT